MTPNKGIQSGARPSTTFSSLTQRSVSAPAKRLSVIRSAATSLKIGTTLSPGLETFVTRKRYGMGHLCTWDITTLPYQGLNTHNHLQQSIAKVLGGGDATLENLALSAEALQEKTAAKSSLLAFKPSSITEARTLLL